MASRPKPSPGAEHDGRLPVKIGQYGRAVGGIEGPQARAAQPHRLAVGLVEGDKAVGRDGVFAPAGHHAADNDEILEDQRHIGPPAVRADHPVFFAHRVRPEGLSGLPVEALKVIAKPQGIDVPGSGIAGDARPAIDALVGGGIGQKDVEHVLPDWLAGGGVDAHDLFAFARRFGVMPAQTIELAAHHDGRAARPELGSFPDQIFAVGRPGADEPLLA